MNGVLRNALTNPWASVISFLPVVAFLTVLFFCIPRPLPTVEGVSGMPWWPPLGGLVGAGAVAGLTITANILMSLLTDKYGWFGTDVHPLGGMRMLGAVLMVAGIGLIAKSDARGSDAEDAEPIRFWTATPRA